MKKTMRVALTVMMALLLICPAALADETPQPEGGKKFESNWGKMCGLIEIVYEEEGYRVSVDLFNPVENTGTLWEYSCYYVEKRDDLESISSRKIGYALNPDTLERTLDEYEYEGIDDVGQTAVFSLSADGALRWKDGREDRGRDLEFRDIGCFEGVWRNEAEEIYAEFHWEGLFDENTYCYFVYVARGEKEYHLAGAYDPASGRLACYDAAASIRDAEDIFAARDAGKPCDAFFTNLGGGKLLLEMEDAVQLEYDILGPES